MYEKKGTNTSRLAPFWGKDRDLAILEVLLKNTLQDRQEAKKQCRSADSRQANRQE
ncbi:MAG: hypothetical protein KHY27_03460 [Butyricicoccus pullicaecorum]|nr:hypothetical protein [Butyricicoccus pullicaecorum]